MPDEVRADPVELGRAAELALAESQELFDALTTTRDGLPLGAAALGGTGAAEAVAGAHGRAVEAAGAAVERLVGVLEEDVDGLYQTAFAFQQADLRAAADLLEPFQGNPPV